MTSNNINPTSELKSEPQVTTKDSNSTPDKSLESVAGNIVKPQPTKHEVQPISTHDTVPSNWSIKAGEGDQIEAYNNMTRATFNGTVAEMNSKYFTK
jgi:hypothetical protein